MELGICIQTQHHRRSSFESDSGILGLETVLSTAELVARRDSISEYAMRKYRRSLRIRRDAFAGMLSIDGFPSLLFVYIGQVTFPLSPCNMSHRILCSVCVVVKMMKSKKRKIKIGKYVFVLLVFISIAM